jgi:hypothetical protein
MCGARWLSLTVQRLESRGAAPAGSPLNGCDRTCKKQQRAAASHQRSHQRDRSGPQIGRLADVQVGQQAPDQGFGDRVRLQGILVGRDQVVLHGIHQQVEARQLLGISPVRGKKNIGDIQLQAADRRADVLDL